MTSKRRVGPFEVEPIGLGCMCLSHAYGRPPSPEEGARVLHRALDLGYDFLDTAALYGFGRNETLIGDTLASRRGEYILTSKCGMTGVNGKRVIDGRPETLHATIDAALRRLKTEVIDLYYLHRVDPNVAVEESVGAMADMLKAGKIRAIGLSEVSAATLRRAHAVHPIAAVQTEYSPWSRNAEIAVLDACLELGVAFVAFSPLARGFLTDRDVDWESLPEGDIRLSMPRFREPHLSRNLALREQFRELAREAGCTAAQLALAWALAKGDHIIPIPGTTSLAHLEENFEARKIRLDPAIVREIDQTINQITVAGPRYGAAAQADIDTEEFGVAFT